MGALHQLACVDAKGGMNAADPPHKIATNQFARLVNCAIVDGLPTTRFGVRAVPITGEAAEAVSDGRFQGSIFYNPAKGQGGIVLAEDNATLALAASGRVYLVQINGRRGVTKAIPKEVTGGLITNSQQHLAWLSQWEDLLIKTDGQSSTFIYDPNNGASFSRGYNTIERDKSEIPNGATITLYAHGRGVAVVNCRNMLVGDSIFRTNLTSSVNLKQFTEQVYQSTGQYFLPPSSMGGITAGAILPLQDTQHGHGDIMFHCEDGIFSLDISQAPRSGWANLPLVKCANLEGGATGPYAIDLQVGDQIFRSRRGADALRSARANAQLEGSPDKSMSPQVDTWFASDYPRWLRFASVKIWSRLKRIAFTVCPQVQGSHRWHRGFVVRNTNPNITTNTEPAVWEGLWTLPPEVSGVIQFVGGLFDGEERQFAWCYGQDRKLRLVEFAKMLREDVLEDGSTRPIRCQAVTRLVDAGKHWASIEYGEAVLYLRNVVGTVHWGVWYRTADDPEWTNLRAGVVRNPETSVDGCDLRAAASRSVVIPLGRPVLTCRNTVPGVGGERKVVSRGIQFLVRWQGYAQLENVKVVHGSDDQMKETLQRDLLNMEFTRALECEYDDFEYSATDEALWI